MFIAISELMGASGMHSLLRVYWRYWWILTGSNAGSNAMFIKLQMQTAQNVALRGNMSQHFKTPHHQ